MYGAGHSNVNSIKNASQENSDAGKRYPARQDYAAGRAQENATSEADANETKAISKIESNKMDTRQRQAAKLAPKEIRNEEVRAAKARHAANAEEAIRAARKDRFQKILAQEARR